MNNSAAHTALKTECLLAYGAQPGVKLFNNPVGSGWMGKPVRLAQSGCVTLLAPRYVEFGLAPGSSDIIGLRAITITPDMVGKTIAQFVAPEIKTGRGKLHDDQPAFIATVNRLGGHAGIVRSVEDMGRFLTSPIGAIP